MSIVRADIERFDNPDFIAKLIQKHDAGRYGRLQRYYEAKHDILWRKENDSSKPNNKIVNNYPGYIVDVNVGYFMGEPVSYTSMDEVLMQELQDIFDYNDEQDENIELAKGAGIKGRIYELLYMDEDAQIRFNNIDTDNMILVYNTKITPEPVAAIRYWQDETDDDNKKVYIELYTDREIIEYVMHDGKIPVMTGYREHPFQDVPVVEYPNNDERQGDFEKVLTGVDAYDKSQSDTANDFEYFADAYLKIKNMSGTDENDVSSMKRNRVILVDDDGDADWLIKTINDTALENYKTRLQDDIYRFSKTPNLTDEKFAGNLSGIALRYKLWGLEQNASQKERKFKKGLQRRIELICNVLEVKGKKYDWRDVELTFTRNIPAVLPELVEVVRDLKGTVSQQTLLSLLPFIEDPAKELEKLKEEMEGRIDLSLFMDDEEDEDGDVGAAVGAAGGNQDREADTG